MKKNILLRTIDFSPMIKIKFLFIYLSIVLISGCTESTKVPDKPNVLFISVDDLNDWVGVLGGYPKAITPNIDALAKRGVLFTNAHCAAPLCGPSRAALMTGISPASSGIYKNNQLFRGSPVLKDAITLPQHFMNNGYKAIGAGKIYHGSDPDPASWDDYWPSQEKNEPNDPKPNKNSPLIKEYSHFGSPLIDIGSEEMGDWRSADWVINQLQSNHDKPLFLAFGIYRPHLPWNVPKKYYDKFPLDSIILPEVNNDDHNDIPDIMTNWVTRPDSDHKRILKSDKWKIAVQSYLASISFADECVGRVVDALDNSKFRDNTVIVLFSDHGWHLGEKLHWRKATLWEESTRSNLLFVAPNVAKVGGICDEPVSLLDIYPTLSDICNLPVNEKVEGHSLLDMLKDPSIERDIPALTTNNYKKHALRTKKWRYIHYVNGAEELYDREKDPMEWTNLASDPAFDQTKDDLKKFLPKYDHEEVQVYRDEKKYGHN
jgi:arylsulfatase A-like enzyme